MPLTKLTSGQKAKIIRVAGAQTITSRLIDMGLVKGVKIELIRKAPLGDPIEIKVRNFLLSLRKEEAETITVEQL
ncbi:MAG: ferrous iron transport protein A [Candidatus Margulisbacteria bacterium]|jgi:Fe2+ transport system protein FeoA|nr:ferrous iron transport protein A [Candidatus Margulisiibacteriota bacterium]